MFVFFEELLNKGMADIEKKLAPDELKIVKDMVKKHYSYTNSEKADKILKDWSDASSKFVKVVPRDYKRMIDAIGQARQQGMDKDEAEMYAFTKNRDDASRLSGN